MKIFTIIIAIWFTLDLIIQLVVTTEKFSKFTNTPRLNITLRQWLTTLLTGICVTSVGYVLIMILAYCTTLECVLAEKQLDNGIRIVLAVVTFYKFMTTIVKIDTAWNKNNLSAVDVEENIANNHRVRYFNRIDRDRVERGVTDQQNKHL